MPFERMKVALNQAIKQEEKENPASVPLRLGEASVPDSVSRRHILVLGTSGTGKSVFLNHYLTALKARRALTAGVNKCVIYDVKGEFCGKHLGTPGPDLLSLRPAVRSMELLQRSPRLPRSRCPLHFTLRASEGVEGRLLV